MNLKLKHLAPYLPYGLKLKINTSIGTFDRNFELDCGHDFNLHLSQGNVKPILRPLSDLAFELSLHKTVLHQIAIDLGLLKDDNFIFEYDFSDYGNFGNSENVCLIDSRANTVISIPKIHLEKALTYEIFNKLVSEHFDVFGLIDKGLAISIHDIGQVVA
jgi:hypothetical protein